MNDEVTIQLSTFDRTRRAEVTLPRALTGGDLIAASMDNWQLPRDTDYHLMNTTRSLQIPSSQPLTSKYVVDGDVVTIQPLLVAGAGVGDARRRTDQGHLEDLCARSGGRLAIKGRKGSPPFKYLLEFRMRSVESAGLASPPHYRDEHRVEVALPARYPLEAPEAKFLTPIFHPHVYPNGKVCIGFKHLPTEFLDRFVERLTRILVFDRDYIDLNSPANHAAVAWVRSHWKGSLFPTHEGLPRQAAAPGIRFKDRSDIKWG